MAARSPPQAPSWLGALSDSRTARALGLLHDEPARAWTVNTLAREVGMSRSGFAARFSKLVGVPPLQYLMGWRMTLAAELPLADTSSTISDVARSVGYDSEAAFTVTFIMGLLVACGGCGVNRESRGGRVFEGRRAARLWEVEYVGSYEGLQPRPRGFEYRCHGP